MNQNNQKPKDPLRKLKLLAYRRSVGPTDGKFTYEQFLDFARMYLSIEKKVLFNDPLFDSYSDEGLIVEYFSNIFVKDKKRREDFEADMGIKDSEYEEFLKFADEMIEKNQDELEEKASEMEESVSFAPDSLGGDD